MASNKSEKNTAEQYREERKQRLAKAAKQKKKGAAVGSRVNGLFSKVFAVILIAAILGGIGWVAYTQVGLRERFSSVVSVGDYKVSAVIYNYQYRMSWDGLIGSYGSYLEQMGAYDTSKAPSEQAYTDIYGEDAGLPEFKYWDEFFTYGVLQSLQSDYALYKEALKVEGYDKLNEEDQKKLEEDLKEMTTSAAKNNFTLNAYMKHTFGTGFNEKRYREQYTMTMIAQRYAEYKQNQLGENYSKDKLRELYEEDRDAYDVINMRSYAFTAEKLTQNEGESDADFKKRQEEENSKTKKKAEALRDSAKDEKAFLDAVAELNKDTKDYDAKASTLKERQSYASVKGISENAAKWAFDANRKAGDSAEFGVDGSYTVIFMLAPRYAPYTVDVLHILLPFHEDSSTENVTAAEKEAALNKANTVYEEWKNGAKTADSFKELAKSKSADTESAKNGGLIDNIGSDSEYVTNFLNWSLDVTHKVGDAGIIETEYGYHIMYLAKANTDSPDYMETIKQEKMQSDYSDYLEELLEQEQYKMVKNEKSLAWATKQDEKWIKELILSKSYSS